VTDRPAGKPRFFKTPAAFRAWLEKNHATARELLVGFHKTRSGTPSISWPESVDAALCFGWIDGVRRRIDERRYSIRFTPRKAESYWSAVNTRRALELIDAGQMRPAGRAAFDRRDRKKTRQYLYEREHAALTPTYEQMFRKDQAAWTFFCAQPPGYRRLATLLVTTAKQEETRLRRLDTIITHSARGMRFRWM
jgi:uncharacterized protein YdeI (YjbR/CyaY-like superfamily)